jgi:acyl-CoA synthetase (AMP-forming)/AMP-acid ligase II
MDGLTNGGREAVSLLHEAIEDVARTDPQRPALYFGDHVITFGALAARIGRVAASVAATTEPGDRVALVGDNHPSWVEAYFGVPRAGRILVFLNHRLAAAELAAILERSGATVVVGPAAELDRLRPLMATLPTAPTLLDLDQWEGMAAGGEPELEPVSPPVSPTLPTPDPDDPIWLIFTSGTTGLPKGATLTHRNLAASLAATAVGRPMGPDDVFLYTFPLCHVAGYNLVRNLAAGRPVVLMERFAPAEFVALAARHRVNRTTMAATMLSSLLDHLDEHPDELPRLETLTEIAYGAAPRPATLLRRAFDQLGVDFTQGYGMTELAGNAVFLNAEDHRRALGGADHLLTSAGRPAPNVELRVVDDDGHDVVVGIPGEILIRADQVMVGYWRDDEATRSAFNGRWFHTGDVGVFDRDGVLSVVDRKKDVIVTGGENVSSREVEDEVLRSCPDVREVAVIGVPDPHWGENVCAVIVLKPGAMLTPDSLVGRVRQRLAGFKSPRHVVEIAELPRNSLGKVRKSELRQWLGEHQDLLGPRR